MRANSDNRYQSLILEVFHRLNLIDFRMFPLHQFSTSCPPQMSQIPAISCCTLSLYLYLTSSSPIPTHLESTHKIYCISHSQGDPYIPLKPSSSLALSRSMDCSMWIMDYLLISECIPYLSFWVWLTSLRIHFLQLPPFACKFHNASFQQQSNHSMV